MIQINQYIIFEQRVRITVMGKIVENYMLIDYLGKGQYGKVYRAIHMDTHIEVAVKMISMDKFAENPKLSELTRNQIDTLKVLEDNINVVKFVEMIKTNNNIYLIYQYCQGGTLETIISQTKIFTEKQALTIFRQLLTSMKSLHQNFILHRDIKPNNIFFKSGHLKLADFGFCKRLRGADDFTQTSLGSPLYMAPQVLNGDVYGSKADVWSCGILLYEMLFGKCPYGDCNVKQMLQIYNDKGEKSVVPFPQDVYVSAVTKMMLKRMLEKDQFRRISWQDFFYQYDITAQGTVVKKQKDFQYDLMKLIKRNSVVKKRKETVFKFDWTKITEKNSSVHSEDCEVHPVTGEEQLNELLTLKKQVKQFQNQHAKMLELTFILQSVLDSPKQFQYSNTIMFFLVHTLSTLSTKVLANLQQFSEANKDLLASNPSQAQSINKLQVVFKNQAKSVSVKANSIKVTLMQCQTLLKDVFKFPQKPTVRKYLGQYIKNYEQCSKNSTVLANQGNKQEALFLLKVVWGCILSLQLQNDEKEIKKWKSLREIFSIKPQTTKFEISVQLNRLLVFLGI